MLMGEDLVTRESGNGAGGEDAPKVARRGRVVTAVLGWTESVGTDWSTSCCDDGPISSCLLLSSSTES